MVWHREGLKASWAEQVGTLGPGTYRTSLDGVLDVSLHTGPPEDPWKKGEDFGSAQIAGNSRVE